MPENQRDFSDYRPLLSTVIRRLGCQSACRYSRACSVRVIARIQSPGFNPFAGKLPSRRGTTEFQRATALARKSGAGRNRRYGTATCGNVQDHSSPRKSLRESSLAFAMNTAFGSSASISSWNGYCPAHIIAKTFPLVLFVRPNEIWIALTLIPSIDREARRGNQLRPPE